ncbi:unnamed protein product, partial [marine sediment metagenome]
GLDKLHCDNCYFWREGKCDYDAIMREHSKSSKEATERLEREPAKGTTGSTYNQNPTPFPGF